MSSVLVAGSGAAQRAGIAEVAVALPVMGTFSYRLPERLVDSVHVGTHVIVPFGGRRAAGLVLRLQTNDAARESSTGDAAQTTSGAPESGAATLATAEIAEVAEGPPVPATLLQLAQFTADYYGAPIGEVLRTFLPPGTRPTTSRRIAVTQLGREALAAAGRALHSADLDLTSDEEQLLVRLSRSRGGLAPRTLTKDTAAVRRLQMRGMVEPRDRVTRARKSEIGAEPAAVASQRPELTPAQSAALAAIEEPLRGNRYRTFLLHGVTGSGKTEVYLRAAETTLALGRSALILVPEIALTPQLAARFRARFGEQVAVLHSELSPGERVRQWHRLRQGEAWVGLGARSAVFAPLANVGLVVVDEEHDASYKQQDGVRYHARDLALVRARDEQAVSILGSATPSLESYHAARRDRYTLLRMPERVTPQPLPPVEVLDLRIHQPSSEDFLTARLREALAATLDARQQAILFLNRRGFATLVLCRECGHTARCRDCSVALVWHRARRHLVCHWCGLAERMPDSCPACRGIRVETIGIGTERVESAIKAAFPTARIGRVDRDAMPRGAADSVLEAAARREIDILIGTQMLAKGHDLPGVTLVGVLLADVGMSLPDFRATERTFQLLTQVAGRAGRGQTPGRVLVQTFQPNHPGVLSAIHHDYESFYARESAARAELRYPPYGHLVLVRFEGPVATLVEQRARAIAATIGVQPDLQMLGPCAAPIARLRGNYRWQIALRSVERKVLRPIVRQLAALGNRDRVRVGLDVDPVSLL